MSVSRAQPDRPADEQTNGKTQPAAAPQRAAAPPPFTDAPSVFGTLLDRHAG